jgi:hypothetical protein
MIGGVETEEEKNQPLLRHKFNPMAQSGLFVTQHI